MNDLRLRYETIEFGDQDMHVRSLRDLQEFSDDSGEAEALGISSARWSLFGVIWESGRALANLMYRYKIGDRRILEIGCGLGLASLVVNRRGFDVTATDRHPEAGAFLTANTELNHDSPIPFHRISWDDESVDLGKFELIIGSDVLYESDHAEAIAKFVLKHASQDCEFIVVDAGRGECRSLERRLTEAGFEHDLLEILETDYAKESFKGRTHRYRRSAT